MVKVPIKPNFGIKRPPELKELGHNDFWPKQKKMGHQDMLLDKIANLEQNLELVQRYLFLKWYQIFSEYMSFVPLTFTKKRITFGPDPPNNYFLLHFQAIISPEMQI